ncbi:MAG: hypothetical protein IKA71_09255 [Lentisphaeria bacterium]|nr:hypothetical protein [Lentisphaeria bacterium]
MDRQKAGGNFFHRLFAFKIRLLWQIFILIFLLTAAAGGYLTRALWFDEALVMFNFASLDSPLEIYRSYFIPNNQIVHTVCLRILRGMPDICLRLFSFCCSGILLFLIWYNCRKKCGALPLAAVLWTWMLSVPFMLYATAVRGYMLAALLTVITLLCGRKYAVSGQFSAWAGWFAGAYLTVGVMPSALAGIAAAGLYILPLLGRRFYLKKEFYMLAAAPPAAFLAFYLPVWDKLTGAFAIREGWHVHWAALLALALGVTGSFNVLLPAAAWQAVKSRWNFRKFCYLTIWLLPLGMFLFPVAPFPRVWFVLFPVWAVLLAQGIKKSLWIRCGGWIAAAALAGVMHSRCVSEKISPWCALAGQDDFFAPYFLRGDFRPEQIEQILSANPGNSRIYVPLQADPWAVMRQLMRPVDFDSPRGKVKYLQDNTVVILRSGDPPQMITDRFGGKLISRGSAGYFEIYIWRVL